MIALRGANPERAYTDGAGGLGAGLAESRRQRLRVNTAVFKVFCKGVLSGKDRDSKIFRARGKKASKTA